MLRLCRFELLLLLELSLVNAWWGDAPRLCPLHVNELVIDLVLVLVDHDQIDRGRIVEHDERKAARISRHAIAHDFHTHHFAVRFKVPTEALLRGLPR